MNIDFQPLNDMVLVKPDPAQDKIGSIIVPEMAKTYGHQEGPSEDCFIGTVVAVGPGDKHKPFHLVICPDCGSRPTFIPRLNYFECGCMVPVAVEVVRPPMQAFARRQYTLDQANEWNEGRYAMELKLGDRVAYPRRPSAPGGEYHVDIDGERYQLFHEQQFGFAIVADDTEASAA
jgi:hypothetical protein